MAIPFYSDEDEEARRWPGPSPVAAAPGPAAVMPPHMQFSLEETEPAPAPRPAPPLTMTADEFGLDDEPAPAMTAPVAPPAPAPAPVARSAPDADPDRTLRLIDAGLQGLGGKDWDSRFWDKRSAKRATDTRNATLQDPNSPESIHRRQVLSRMLGYKPAELEGLSAADLQGFDPGKAAISLAMARSRSAEAKQTADAKAAADAAKSTEQRGYDEDKWAQQNAITSAQQDDRSRTMAGINTARATDQTLLTDRLARERQEAHDKRAAERQQDRDKRSAATRAGEKEVQDTQEYASKLETTGIPQARSNIDVVRGMVREARARNGGRIFAGKDDVVRRDNSGKSWGLASAPTQKLLQELQALRNVQIKNQSGTAVSASEMGRVASAQGANVLDSEEGIESFLDAMARAAEVDERTLLGGYGPKIKQQYQQNIHATTPPALGMVRVRDPASKKTKDIPAANAAAAKQRGLEVLDEQ